MQWHSIYSGPTTAKLRQVLARRAEFYLTADHDAVIDLIMDKVGYLVHVSTVTERFSWSRNRAIRVLEEIADAFQLPTATVNSPHGKGTVYMWGKVIESGSWSVSVPENASSYSPVQATDRTTVPVPVSTPVPDSEPVRRDELAAAAARTLAETKLSNIEAARGLISYGIRELDMSAEAAADTLILMSRSESTGLTRATLREWAARPCPTVPALSEDDVDVECARAQRAGELTITAEEHPELAVGIAVVRELNEARPYQRVDLQEIRDWDQDVRGNIRAPQPAEVALAVREALDGYAGPLSVGYVGRIMRRHREEAETSARRTRARLVTSTA